MTRIIGRRSQNRFSGLFSAAIRVGKLVLAQGTTGAPGYNSTFFAAIIVT
jgi:hypothetical protein